MRARSTLALGAACLALAAPPAIAQGEPAVDRPWEVRYVLEVADSILSTAGAGISLEAFRDDTVTGVFLRGSHGGRDESIGFGRGADRLRYLWFSVEGGPEVEYIVLLYDLDSDLLADFLLVRTIDRNLKSDWALEYRVPAVRNTVFEIALQPACAPPRCDPATWTERPRQVVVMPRAWFDPWTPLLSLAAARGERWLGQPVALLGPPGPGAPP
ncbi:MAG TPA: hypothetical protein VG799_08435 [Gemmatimonadota bacterium]|nr:hypothetical protein [Gemmatimonadota bacterium]